MKKYFVFILLLFIISNFLPRFTIGKKFRFSTKNSEFVYDVIPSKGRTLETMERNFQEFIKDNPQSSDTIIFRTFEKNHLEFWNYIEYLIDPKWDYPLLKNKN